MSMFFSGCSKCLKQFQRQVNETGKTRGDFSGFDRQAWTSRQAATHKEAAKLAKQSKTESERKTLEKSGARWSDLFRLPYFDPIDGHTIDPMHCIFLGIAKHMTKMYIKSGIIDKPGLVKLQDAINNIRVPSAVGRIPNKISSGFCSFSADQWKNWTLIYSSTALKPVLPTEHYKIWLKFVHATSILCRKIVTSADIQLADQLYLSFCRDVEHKYGNNFVTPNFHMLCHLADVVRKYGPVYSFWCYSFER